MNILKCTYKMGALIYILIYKRSVVISSCYIKTELPALKILSKYNNILEPSNYF